MIFVIIIYYTLLRQIYIMEYIRKKIERKVLFLESNFNTEELKTIYQAYFEYLMLYTLSYLWNKNFGKCNPETKEYILQNIQKPSIGDIEAICRRLDTDKEIFRDKRLSKKFSKYPNFRNEKIGHGFIFADGTSDFVSELKDFCNTIKSSEHFIFKNDIDIVRVLKEENGFYLGISYKSNGSDYSPWKFPSGTIEFEINTIYGYHSNTEYFKLSPFIEIETEDEFYMYSSVSEPLLGNCKFNRLLKSGTIFLPKLEFCNLDIEVDTIKRKTQNGTIINIFKKNFSKFIDTPIKEKISSFLFNTKHSVTATIWGHGGVGKTATVQKICDELGLNQNRKFDYIVFTTAKDRSYNYLTGKIEELNDRISSFEELIKSINQIIINKAVFEIEYIVEFKQKILIIIDDFETFSDEEKSKISVFLKKLNPDNHRVLITTRANIIIGEEIKTSELSKEETSLFLQQVFENEIGDKVPPCYLDLLSQNETKEKIHWATSGRPLFIYQLAYVIAQKGSIEEAVKFDIKITKNAIDFLYGKIYEYLSNLAKDIFVIISLLVTENDLSNITQKIAFILNIENRQDDLVNALNELVKLKILEIKEDNFFYLYSKEILAIMHLMYSERPDSFKGICNQRLLQISRDKKLDTEQALLQFADSNRYSKNEEEVISTYKQILNRPNALASTRLQALLNLTSYLVIHRGKRETAILTLENYYAEFRGEGQYIKMLSSYYWANGAESNKEKSIQILGDYVSSNKNLKRDINLELLGLLLTYKAIRAISQKEQLKDKLNFQEISRIEFSKQNSQLKQDFKNIIEFHGWPLYSYIEAISFDNISSASRQNIVTGFNQFADLLIRQNDFENAYKICQYGLDNFPENFQGLFKNKLRRIKSFDSYTIREPKQTKISDFGMLLKEAMEKK